MRSETSSTDLDDDARKKASIDSYPFLGDAGSLFMQTSGGTVIVKKGRPSVIEIKRANSEKIGQSAALAMRPKGLC